MARWPTDLLYLRDAVPARASTRRCVGGRRRAGVALDRTVFYPTGGGQPHDTGRRWAAARRSSDVRKDGRRSCGTRSRAATLPAVGDAVHGEVDWERRHALMRTHTALHVLCGVIWNEWGVAGHRREHGAAVGADGLRVRSAARGLRPADRGARQRRARAPTVRSRCRSCPRDAALEDEDLIRTKVNLIPESVPEIRVVDIVGLDKQADGGTHVRSTAEVGRIRVVKTESKGKGNKRIRIEVVDA